METTRICKKCGKDNPISHFYFLKNTGTYRRMCASCYNGGEPVRVCATCHIPKPLGSFYKGTNKSGLRYDCKTCFTKKVLKSYYNSDKYKKRPLKSNRELTKISTLYKKKFKRLDVIITTIEALQKEREDCYAEMISLDSACTLMALQHMKGL